MHTAPECLVITVKTRTELDAALDDAVDLLKPEAVTAQVGISVTRLAPGRYEARLNSDVPPGVTLERWEPAAMGEGQRGASGRSGRQRV